MAGSGGGLGAALGRMLGRPPLGRVVFNMRPVPGPWGGSSVFVSQLAAYLRRRGYEVGFELAGRVDVVVLVDARAAGFGATEIAAYRRTHPATRVLHRVNECDQRKNTRVVDEILREADRVADFTVFISDWLRDYHAERWFDTARPHRSIYNGADPGVFHPVGGAPWTGRGPFRVVTHHWSDNPLKGFDVYQEVDGLVAGGALADVELWVIGRWPAGLAWRRARTWPATHGADLAGKLRACHAYLTASRWEPGGMHHVEGAQCGLPLLYHEDGGGIVEAGRRYGIGYRGDVASAIRRMREEHAAMRRRVFDAMPSGDRMCFDYLGVVQWLQCEGPAPATPRAAATPAGKESEAR